MGARIQRLAPKVLADGGTVDIDLSVGSLYRFLTLDLTVVAASGAGTPAENEDGARTYIQELSILPSGVDAIMEGIDGVMAGFIAEMDRGGPLTNDTLDATASSALSYRLTLPVFFTLPGTRNPFAAGFDPRGLDSVKLRIRLRSMDTCVGGTTETVTSVTGTVVEHLIRDVAAAAAARQVERRFVGFSRTIAGAGDLDPISLKRGGRLRRIYLCSRATGGPITGTRSDSILNYATIERDTGDFPVHRIPWLAMKDLPGSARDYIVGTGFGLIDLDPEGMLADDQYIDAGNPGLASLNLHLNAAGAGHVVGVAEYLVQRR